MKQLVIWRKNSLEGRGRLLQFWKAHEACVWGTQAAQMPQRAAAGWTVIFRVRAVFTAATQAEMALVMHLCPPGDLSPLPCASVGKPHEFIGWAGQTCRQLSLVHIGAPPGWTHTCPHLSGSHTAPSLWPFCLLLFEQQASLWQIPAPREPWASAFLFVGNYLLQQYQINRLTFLYFTW